MFRLRLFQAKETHCIEERKVFPALLACCIKRAVKTKEMKEDSGWRQKKRGLPSPDRRQQRRRAASRSAFVVDVEANPDLEFVLVARGAACCVPHFHGLREGSAPGGTCCLVSPTRRAHGLPHSTRKAFRFSCTNRSTRTACCKLIKGLLWEQKKIPPTPPRMCSA